MTWQHHLRTSRTNNIIELNSILEFTQPRIFAFVRYTAPPFLIKKTKIALATTSKVKSTCVIALTQAVKINDCHLCWLPYNHYLSSLLLLLQIFEWEWSSESSFFNFSECNEFNFFMKVYEILRDLSLVTSLLFRSFLAIRTQIELISLILTPYSTLLVMALTNFVLFGEKVALLYSTRLNHTGRANCWTKEMVLIHFVLLVKKCWTFYTQHD